MKIISARNRHNSVKASTQSIKASTTDPITTDFTDFGVSERGTLCEILDAWGRYGLPIDFEDDKIVPAFNKSNGRVFLTNAAHQVVMIDDSMHRLESWYTTPSGYEGFLVTLVSEYNADPDSWEDEDIEYLRELGADVGVDEEYEDF